MAKLKTEHVFTGNLEKVFAGICEFKKYPKYLPGVTKIEVLPAQEKNSICQVRYELNIIKTFYYVLNMFEEKPNKIWWELSESNLMNKNDGSWTFKEKKDGSTKATYTLDLQFKGLVPSAITDRVAKANLPAMMEGFQKLIDENN